jgi:hypothetical protein
MFIQRIFFREPHTYMRDDDMGMDIDATNFTRQQRPGR